MAMKVLINGGAGRMGQRILSLLLQDPELSLSGLLEHADHPSQGSDAGILAGRGELGAGVVAGFDELKDEPDVVIDFSIPAVTLELAEKVGSLGIPLVIGTTGLTDTEREQLRGSLKGVACVQAPNMAVGVNVLFKLAADTARMLGEGFDVEIVEAHHHFKADAPSGTALRLAEGITQAKGVNLSEKACYGRQGRPGPRSSDEVGIMAVRAGDIVGEHTVIFGGVGERLELVHRAHTRDNFAKGALRAAKWVVKQQPGMYDMMDVLGLR